MYINPDTEGPGRTVECHGIDQLISWVKSYTWEVGDHIEIEVDEK